MSLQDREAEMLAEEPPPIDLCKVGRIRAALSPEDQAFLDDRLATTSSLHVAKVLARDGIQVGDATIRKHRERVCRCVAH